MELTTTRSLELLGNIKKTTADFAKKDEQLTRELRQQRTTLERQHEEQSQHLQQTLEGNQTSLLDAYSSAMNQVTTVYNKRRDRIHHSHQEAVRFMPRRVRSVRENWLGSLQMKQHKLQQKLIADQDTAKNTHAENAAQLSDLHKQLAKMVRAGRQSISGYGSLKRSLESRLRAESAVPLGIHTAALEEQLQSAKGELFEFRKIGVARFFSHLPLLGAIIVALLIGGGVAYGLGANQSALIAGGAVAAVLALLLIIIHQSGLKTAKPQGLALVEALGKAKDYHASTSEFLKTRLANESTRLQSEFDEAVAHIETERGKVDEVEARFKKRAKDKLENQFPRVTEKINHVEQAKLAYLTTARDSQLAQEKNGATEHTQQLAHLQQEDWTAFNTEEAKRWQDLQADWQAHITPLYAELNELNQQPAAVIPSWETGYVESWAPVQEFADAVKFGNIQMELKKHELPLNPKLALPGSAKLTTPLALSFPSQGSLLIESPNSADGGVTNIFNNVILRLFATMPPGKAAMTIIDPVGLGKNFAGLMHLSDYEESLINRRIWTQRDQIEERLSELNEHIEKVIQMYLRSEYANIAEYNASAGTVAEKYHFLVVADFPEGFSETAVRRLQSIAISGPRCGVFTLIHWDKRQTPPDGFVPDELRQGSIVIRQEKDNFFLQRPTSQVPVALTLDREAETELAAEFVHKFGKSSVDSNRVEVPFSQITPAEADYWQNDTTTELRIPIGRTGATKLQHLAIGKGTRQHALFAGKTGSGKSTLFHVIITNLALACSPDQVEFYLIDFKKGVEFKCYASKQLPHARVVAIESDREFGLSVLQRVDEELKRRGDMFRKLGVQDIAGYKRAGGTEAIPRTLLIIDEFQEFYTEDDQIAQTASLLFDRIVRQGRAFGIHVLLGSQTLGGAYTLARATLGQMVIRVALQCNEADAYLIMDENNAAPRLLSRPGEGIYNDAAGAVEGNSPFQVVWLADEDRDRYLDKIHEMAEQRGDATTGPIVFEGNAPADIRENRLLKKALATRPAKSPTSATCWLGAPNAIKGPTAATFHRQSGNHLLIVGQREEAALTMLGVSLVSLAAQYPKEGARFYFLHTSNPDSREANFLENIFNIIPQGVTSARAHELGTVMQELADELKQRTDKDNTDAPAVYVFIHDLHKFKKLRPEDDFSFSMGDDDSSGNPATQLTNLITEGSSQGIHLITTLDTFNNVNRFLNRKSLTEFEMRVVFQMSANDSASLIDNPKASNLGLHRALLYNEHEGTLETFRPYATPDAGWVKEASQALA